MDFKVFKENEKSGSRIENRSNNVITKIEKSPPLQKGGFRGIGNTRRRLITSNPVGEVR